MAPTSSPSAPHVAPMSSGPLNLSSLARDTKRRLHWDDILVLRDSDTKVSHWKWLENARNFSIYTQEDTPQATFAVLAVGTVKASVEEITRLLSARTQDDYSLKMEALYEKDVKDASYLYDVQLEPEPRRPSDMSHEVQPHLSVRTVTFAKNGGWLAPQEQWCYLDATYVDKNTQVLEKLCTTLKPQDVISRERKFLPSTKCFRDVVTGYYIEPARQDSVVSSTSDEEYGPADSLELAREQFLSRKSRVSARVHFYAELPTAARVPRVRVFAVPAIKSEASDKTITQRLMQLARSCHRISLLIRRRRLGVQALADQKKFLLPTNFQCFNCEKHLLLAKLCRVCGNGVCADCSDKYERETRYRGCQSVRVEMVRVCDPCLIRVEASDYTATTDESLQGPTVVPDPKPRSASVDLKDLLKDALMRASSEKRKESVMHVIRYVIEEEEEGKEGETTTDHRERNTPRTLADATTEQEFITALHQHSILVDDRIDYRKNEDRSYQMDTRDPDAVLNSPMSETEEQRLEAVAQISMEALQESIELRILCELAAKEMECSMSTLSFFDRDTLHCVSSNLDSFLGVKLPRANTLCSHTILENRPNIVPHPEADIRFAEALVIAQFGVRFYVAFPILGDQDQIIGSFCVMNEVSKQVTETQFVAFRKLADTVNKVVRVHIETRKRTASVC